MEYDKRDLERQLNELKLKFEQAERSAAEQRQVDEKKHAEEIQFLKRTNQQLKVRTVARREREKEREFICQVHNIIIIIITRLTALFRDYPGKPVPQKGKNQPGFCRSKRQ